MPSLVLLSGGLDSTIALHMTGAARALWIGYGQRHAIERASARRVADHAGVPLEEITLELGFGASSLTGGGDCPVVPGRNAILASVGAARAVALGCGELVMGTCADDHAIFADCRPAFLGALAQTLSASSETALCAPLSLTSKGDAIRWAMGHDRAREALALTWSCYDPQSAGARSPVPCDTCLACETRAAAFSAAGVPDPARR